MVRISLNLTKKKKGMLNLIKKASLNTLALTLTEKANVEEPINWLFRFVNEQSKKEYFCFLDDLSTTPTRFNLFNLYEGTDITLPLGDYTYYVYQMPTIVNTFSDGILCEQGKINVWDDKVEEPTFQNTTKIINVYE